jgi:hypothetical protein
MKLRLFGCAAAFAFAGSLCASAQEGPDSKMKDRGPDAAPAAESSEKAPTRAMKEAPAERSKSAERAPEKSDRSDAKAERKADQADTKSERNAAKNDGDSKKNVKSEAAAEKSTQSGSNKKASDSAANDKADNRKEDRAKSASEDAKDDSARSAQSKDDSSKGDRRDREQATDRSDSAAKNVQITAEKRDRVQSSLRDVNIKRETKVDVNISIGSRAPRTWAFVPVPVAVVEVVPAYRGYVVAYVGDDYVICDPDTYEVVALFPASGGDYATTGRSSGEGGMAGQCTTSLTLSESDRVAILDAVEMSNEIDARDVTVGWSVPSDVELRVLPRSIVDRTSALDGCRYIVVDGQVALVNPDQHEVVLLIERR